jgi:tRNA C32,U32 (ribose-2'-O)-methylase TrmJ
MDDLRPLIDRIRALLDGRTTDPGGVLTDVEHTLTDGYALALELEGECLRIGRRMGQLTRTVEQPEEAEELRRLAARLVLTEEELSKLRTLLAELRRRHPSRSAA